MRNFLIVSVVLACFVVASACAGQKTATSTVIQKTALTVEDAASQAKVAGAAVASLIANSNGVMDDATLKQVANWNAWAQLGLSVVSAAAGVIAK